MVLAVAALAIAFTLWFLNRAQPLSDWLFWRFAGIYALVLFFGLACLCSGHALLAWPCSKDRMVIGERLLLDMAAGVLLFATGTFLVGIVHGLGSIYFWLFPSALVVAGAPLLARDGAGILSELRRARSRSAQPARFERQTQRALQFIGDQFGLIETAPPAPAIHRGSRILLVPETSAPCRGTIGSA